MAALEPAADASTPAVTRPVLVVGTHSIHVRRVVQGLCDAGQPVVLITSSASPLVVHPLLLEQRCADFHLLSLGAARSVRRAITQWRPRVVHAHQANSVAWHAARGAAGTGVPLVVTLWGSDVLLLPQRSVLTRWMVRHTLRSAALWTADAHEVLAAARRLAGDGPLRAQVVMGVDELPASLAPLWPQKAPRLLSCRLHKPLYRVDDIIRAFAALPAEYATWRLDVAASGPQTAALQALASTTGCAARADFCGFLDADALRDRVRRASVYVSFPESDGTSVSLLEAMAHGCVPVVSDLPANREWVVDGLNGFVVGEPADLGAALVRAMDLSRTTTWRQETAPANHRLVLAKAQFRDNVAQFIAQYARAEATVRGGPG